ncbi:MAG: alpha/beta hydrolase [Acidobacteriota bacterium]|nr:alpha/beta hydrolase [Acidobacteriota bacterium]
MDFIHKFTPGRLPVTVLLLHGSGGDEDDLLPIGKGLAPGAGFLSPRGNVVQNGMCRFFAFPGAEGFDAEEVKTRARDLAEWVGRMCGEYGIDASRLYALGYSNGANIAAALMLLHPGTIAGACLFRSRAVVTPAILPQLKGAPVVISAGQTDHVILAADAQRLGRLMSEAGATVDFVLQNAGHDLTPADFSLAKQWFARLL